MRGWAWGPKWETNLLRVDDPIRLASFAWKWADQKTIYCIGRDEVQSDLELVQALWDVFHKAQVIVAHNGKAFDVKQSNAFFLYHKLPPPSPSAVIDTKTEAKRYFKFYSNSLDDLAQYLGLGGKEHTGGIDLWWDCMDNKPEAWRKMKKYNKHDVWLLEKVYLKMRPWMRIHPNLNVFEDRVFNCKNCLSANLISRGKEPRNGGHKQRYQCKDCGTWNYGTYVRHETEIR